MSFVMGHTYEKLEVNNSQGDRYDNRKLQACMKLAGSVPYCTSHSAFGFSNMQKKKGNLTPSPQGKGTPPAGTTKSNLNTPTKSPASSAVSPFGKAQKEFSSAFLLLCVQLSSRSDGHASLSPSAMLQLGIHSGELIKISQLSQRNILPPFADYASSATGVRN